MSKSKRLLELMLFVNRKRRFTVKELAQEFQVSPRTILRDLQELSELGVPLYSEVGPHGGYQVLNERVLPPIAFTEEEAVAIFFANHALRHFSSLPFEEPFQSALKKFYLYLPGDIRERIDQLKQRFDFFTPTRQAKSPFLSLLLDAAVEQRVLKMVYQSKKKVSEREMQPIGIYAHRGLWYCPAYCFLSRGFRTFRCDRMQKVTAEGVIAKAIPLQEIHLENMGQHFPPAGKNLPLYVELTSTGVEQCEMERWMKPFLHVREDGSGWLEGIMAESDLDFMADYFVGLGLKALVKEPVELVDLIREKIQQLKETYA
jgi:predicted DNA-binding transcriptional regulator YafY